jgi:adenylate cyclase
MNKREGPFIDGDEYRLRAFTDQVSMSFENAKLLDDVQNIKNYNETVLESMSNGVITINEDRKIVTCNAPGLSILRIRPEDIIELPASDFFIDANARVLEKIKKLREIRPLKWPWMQR